MALFICSNCGEGASGWMGRCPSCKEWNTFVEQRDQKDKKKESVQKLAATSLKDIKPLDKSRKQTGIYEFDRVLGGGVVRGEVILITGEPGIGKSTLLLQSLKNLKTLYISGEESAQQVKERAIRLGVPLELFLFADTLQVEGIIEGVIEMKDTIDIVVIDSIQTIYTKEVESPPGSVSQLREASAKLIRLAKEFHIPIIIVGHVTKDGEIAGPKTLEHMVDAVINFEGDPVSHYRILRAQKNRFGSTDEIGIFEMTQDGLAEVNNPLAFVEEDLTNQVPGKAIVGTMEGKRPFFFEIQTLASPTILAMPRRIVKGVDYNKVLLLLAVLRKHLNLNFSTVDIYINVVGGVDVKSTAADLGIAASIISAMKDFAISKHAVFTGEVGLLGEVRSTYGQDRVTTEAKRLKFNSIFSSKTTPTVKDLHSKLSR